MKYFEMKKRAFMSIVNSLKGFIRKVSGTPPITLPDCVDNDSLISYSIEGNGVGDKTNNLFDMEAEALIIVNDAGATRYGVEIIGNGNKFTFSGIYDRPVPIAYKTLKDGVFSPFTEVYQLPHTTPNIDGKLIVYYGTEGTKLSDIIHDFQIEEGTIATEYEPFGYKIPIKMRGKNLFDKSKYSYSVGYYNDNGEYTPASNGLTAHTNNYSEAKPNTEYHCSSMGGYIGGTLAVYFYNKNKEWLSRQRLYITADSLINGYTFATPDNCYYVRFQIFLGDGYDGITWVNPPFDAETFQFEEGTVLTEYEPYIENTINIYLDEPLSGIIKNPIKLPTLKGTTHYSVKTEVQPTNMSVEYYSTRKGE